MSDLLRSLLYCTLFSASVLVHAQEVPAATTAPTEEKSASSEKSVFIIDTLSTAVRSGPGNEYRSISTVRAGENVTYIGKNPANGFIKIRDDAGNEGWLSGEYITDTASPKSSLESLKQQLRQQEMIAAQFEQERSSMQALVSAAETARDQAQQEAALAKLTTATLTKQLAEQNPPLAQNKFVIGGGILAVGLFLGLLLPVIMPSRRKKDRWM